MGLRHGPHFAGHGRDETVVVGPRFNEPIRGTKRRFLLENDINIVPREGAFRVDFSRFDDGRSRNRFRLRLQGMDLDGLLLVRKQTCNP